jgi:hypothetical protein
VHTLSDAGLDQMLLPNEQRITLYNCIKYTCTGSQAGSYAMAAPTGVVTVLNNVFILRILPEGHTPAVETASTEGQHQDNAM